jgi:hypothetical protein
MTRKTQVIVGLSVVGFLAVATVGGAYAYQQYFGGEIGERCDQHLGCKGGVCISRRCQKRCATDADCPSRWGCRTTAVTVTHRRPIGGDAVDDGATRICFSPEALSRAR